MPCVSGSLPAHNCNLIILSRLSVLSTNGLLAAKKPSSSLPLSTRRTLRIIWKCSINFTKTHRSTEFFQNWRKKCAKLAGESSILCRLPLYGNIIFSVHARIDPDEGNKRTAISARAVSAAIKEFWDGRNWDEDEEEDA